MCFCVCVSRVELVAMYVCVSCVERVVKYVFVCVCVFVGSVCFNLCVFLFVIVCCPWLEVHVRAL